jgi:hypothetical protein
LVKPIQSGLLDTGLSIAMEADFCMEALREAAARWGAPQIGCQPSENYV